MNQHARLRSNVGRVAVPVARPEPKPSLVPNDVWESWQKELATQAQDAVEEVHDYEEIITSTQALSGLSASTPADFEVALLSLSQVQLFSGLDRGVLDGLAASARQGELCSGDYLFKEEAHASSFFVVVDGALEILRRTEGREVALRHLERGEVLGLFGLLSGQKRAACARAIGDAVLLEVPAEALNDAIAHHASLRERVVRFFEQRLLEGFVGASRLFSDVDSIARARIIGRFFERRLRAGEALASPGEVANALVILISGKLLLEERPKAGMQPNTFELYPGEFMALTSAFSGAPGRMKVYAPDGATVVMLGHREMADLLRDYPALRALNTRLPAAARTLDRDVWCGHTAVPGL